MIPDLKLVRRPTLSSRALAILPSMSPVPPASFLIVRPASLVTFASLSDSRRKGRRGDRLDDVVDFHGTAVRLSEVLRSYQSSENQ